MNCKEATLLSVQKEEGQLSFLKKLKLLLHLAYCEACRRFIKQSALIIKLTSSYKNAAIQPPPHKLSSETKELLQQKINQSLGK